MSRAPRTGYQELLQLDGEESELDFDQLSASHALLPGRSRVIECAPDSSSIAFPDYPATGPLLLGSSGRRADAYPKRSSFSESVGRWTQNIAESYYRLRRGSSLIGDEEPHEIYYSVFKSPEHTKRFVVPPSALRDRGPVTQAQFNRIVESVIVAINRGIEPKRISQGSSGSYFVYNASGKVVGVFKPKDEEPYGPLSPKWTKWIHRTLFPCFFGRSCLIPNNGYICEAAACTLDRQLMTYIVPFTDTVFLSSPQFYYNYFDRQKFKNGRPLPSKVGSFQLFLHGYEQANVFFQKHPLPDTRRWTDYLSSGAGRSESNGTSEGIDLDSEEMEFRWTPQVLRQFREELEKLVILDYIMRNTDRGLDNWMIKLEWEIIEGGDPFGDGEFCRKVPRLRIGAIDSGLSFPWKHPDEWRSYPFGWLFLPLAVIGQPFSQSAKDHFLRLLCSSSWWQDTAVQMKETFKRDTEFNERLWRRQWAVLKGQAFNVVETLKSNNQGPLELARRTRVLVWNDESEVPLTMPTVAVAHAMETPLRQPYCDHPTTSPKHVKTRPRGSSLTLEARYRELQGSGSRNLWQDLVASSEGSQGGHSVQNLDITGQSEYLDSQVVNGETHEADDIPRETNDDTGFSYAEGSYASKKVIVERLQTVTSKPPLLTWC